MKKNKTNYTNTTNTKKVTKESVTTFQTQTSSKVEQIGFGKVKKIQEQEMMEDK